jgi:hypothetical protein
MSTLWCGARQALLYRIGLAEPPDCCFIQKVNHVAASENELHAAHAPAL